MLIVKVQLPPLADMRSALVYDETREKINRLFPKNFLPPEVKAACEAHPSRAAYFHLNEQDGVLHFGEQAPWQEW